MVIKKRSSSFDNDTELPLVNSSYSEYKKHGDMITTMVFASSASNQQHQNQYHRRDSPAPFWRRWTSTNNNNNNSLRYDSKKFDSLPTWASNPQDDEYVMPLAAAAPVRPPKRQILITTRRRSTGHVWSIMTFVLLLLGGCAYSHYNSQQKREEQDSITSQFIRDQMNIKLRSAEKDVRMLSREVSATQTLVDKKRKEREEKEAAELTGATKELKKAQRQLRELQQQVETYTQEANALRAIVQSYSKRRVEDEFGKGKQLLVELTLQFPDKKEGPEKILIEMASLEVMPHAVHTFLDMVKEGLWDGCSFVINALHVLKAAPLAYQANSQVDHALKFKEAGLNGPVFKEQTSIYPHKEYTVGFAGTDGPAFYINTDDNSDLHTTGDSAFGKLIDGRKTLDRLNEAPTQNGIWFRENIGIKSARVIVK